MDPARSWPNGVSHIFKKSNDVVIRPLFNLRDFRDGEPRPFPNFGRVFLRNLAKFCHCLTGNHLDLQPNLKFSFVRPNLTHLWPGIAINHCGNIKASSSCEKRFVKFYYDWKHRQRRSTIDDLRTARASEADYDSTLEASAHQQRDGSARNNFERSGGAAISGVNSKLANPRPEEATVALHADFATV